MDLEKTIQFLLEQQARFDARQEQFEADILKINNVLLHIANAQERTNEILAALAEKHVELEQKHVELANKLELLANKHAMLTEEIALLTKAQADLAQAGRGAQERLDTLIVTVERHISGHN